MQIEDRAPVRGESRAAIGGDRETVWDILTDFDSWPEWMPGVKAMLFETRVVPGTSFRWRSRGVTTRSTILTVDRPAFISWDDRARGRTGLRTWRLEASGDGCVVHTDETWSGLLPRVLTGPMRNRLQRTLDESVAALKAEVERNRA
jgi:uncharacterized protein YndB with AHSA1/START domain